MGRARGGLAASQTQLVCWAPQSKRTVPIPFLPCPPRSSEWTNLFEFIQAKQLRIENFKEAQRGPGAAAITSYAELEGGDVDAGACCGQRQVWRV